jgi:hypothetical protein
MEGYLSHVSSYRHDHDDMLAPSDEAALRYTRVSLGVAPPDCPLNTLAGAWPGSVGVTDSGDLLGSGAWFPAVGGGGGRGGRGGSRTHGGGDGEAAARTVVGMLVYLPLLPAASPVAGGGGGGGGYSFSEDRTTPASPSATTLVTPFDMESQSSDGASDTDSLSGQVSARVCTT